MKINVIGTGSMGSETRGNQSILVDNVLFDAGSGTVLKMSQLGLHTEDVKYIVITHSHADHFVDLPNFLLGRKIRGQHEKILYIIGGIGIREKTIQLFELTFGDGIPNKYANLEEKCNVKFVELASGESFEDENIKITGYDLEHGTCKPMLGYVLEKDSHTLGYATDTVLCDNVRKICDKSEIVFLDATNPIATKMHMGVQDVLNLKKEYPKVSMYAIHRSDYEHENINEIKFPEDGDIIEI